MTATPDPVIPGWLWIFAMAVVAVAVVARVVARRRGWWM